jgi:hypothetical protein
MSQSQSPNQVHNGVVALAEGVRQTAVAAAAASNSQSAAITAEIAFYRAVLTSCRANNNNSGTSGPMTALKALGVTGA